MATSGRNYLGCWLQHFFHYTANGSNGARASVNVTICKMQKQNKTDILICPHHTFCLLQAETNSPSIFWICETIWSVKGMLLSMGTSAFKVIPSEEAGVEPKCRGKMKAVLLTMLQSNKWSTEDSNNVCCKWGHTMQITHCAHKRQGEN